MQLHQKALVYKGIMNRAKAVSNSYEKLMYSHQGESSFCQEEKEKVLVVDSNERVG